MKLLGEGEKPAGDPALKIPLRWTRAALCCCAPADACDSRPGFPGEAPGWAWGSSRVAGSPGIASAPESPHPLPPGTQRCVSSFQPSSAGTRAGSFQHLCRRRLGNLGAWISPTPCLPGESDQGERREGEAAGPGMLCKHTHLFP